MVLLRVNRLLVVSRELFFLATRLTTVSLDKLHRFNGCLIIHSCSISYLTLKSNCLMFGVMVFKHWTSVDGKTFTWCISTREGMQLE